MRRLSFIVLSLASGHILAADLPACLRMTAPVARGAAILASQVEHVPCPDDMAPVLYDPASRLVRATTDLDAGSAIRIVPDDRLATAARGQRVMAVHRERGVTVSRPATLLNDVADGRPVQATTDDDRRIQGVLQP